MPTQFLPGPSLQKLQGLENEDKRQPQAKVMVKRESSRITTGLVSSSQCQEKQTGGRKAAPSQI